MSIAEDVLEWLWKKAKGNLPLEPGDREKLEFLKSEVAELKQARAAIDNVLNALGSGDTNLWTSVEAKPPFPDYGDRIAREPAKGQQKRRPLILTTVNYKGGVGKTTTTANLAAYFVHELSKRVLIIDLDYQGSMTTVLRDLAGAVNSEGLVGTLLSRGEPADLLGRCTFPLGHKMPNAYFVPAFYPLARIEERLMVEWLLQKTDDDIRYRLARILLDDFIGNRFDVIMIDAAPRLTTATVNALTASTHVLVPAIMNRLSAEPVVNFLKDTQRIMSHLNPRLNYVGIVETMVPTGNDRKEPREVASRVLNEALKGHGISVPRLDSTISRKPALTEGDIAYITDRDVRSMFTALGQEIVSKVGALP